MTAAQFDDVEGRALVEAIHQRKEQQRYCWPTLGEACGNCHRCTPFDYSRPLPPQPNYRPREWEAETKDEP